MNRDWQYKKLKDVCQIARGGSPRPITDYITDDPNGINWIKIGDAIDGDKYIRSTKEKIKPEGMSKSRFVHKGDFILSNSMSFGRPYILDIDGCIHDGWLVLQDKNNQYLKDFLYYLLGSPWMYAEFKALAVGGVVNNLNSKLVGNVMVPVPPIDVQQSIVLELDKINNLLRLKRKQLEIYDKLGQSLFYEMFGDLVDNEKGWEVKKFVDNVHEMFLGPFGSALKVDSYVPESEAYAMVYEQKHAIQATLSLENHFINEEKYRSLERFEVKGGDFIMSCRGTIGKLFRVPLGSPRGIIHPSLMKIRIKEDVYEPTFFSFMLKKVVENQTTKGNCVQMAITAKELGSKLLPVPPISMQQTFAQRITAIEKQKTYVKAAIEKLETLLNSRMDYWFVVQPVADKIVKNAMTEDSIKEIYDEYKQGKDIQDGTIHYDNGHPRGCTDNNMDFRLLADIYNYMKDSGETSVEAIEARYSYTSHAKHCVFELKELGLLTSDDLKAFYIV